jgi:preprotein translocase subunit SecG
MLFGFAIVVFVLVCVLLILLVIIQSDKGGGISGAIGGGLSGANQFLGTQDTANILTRATTGFAIAYMVLCIILSLFLSRATVTQQRSELRQRAETQEQFSPSSALKGQLPLRSGEAQEGAQTPTLPEESGQGQQGEAETPAQPQQSPQQDERE